VTTGSRTHRTGDNHNDDDDDACLPRRCPACLPTRDDKQTSQAIGSFQPSMGRKPWSLEDQELVSDFLGENEKRLAKREYREKGYLKTIHPVPIALSRMSRRVVAVMVLNIITFNAACSNVGQSPLLNEIYSFIHPFIDYLYYYKYKY
jgi:hypothetical protein